MSTERAQAAQTAVAAHEPAQATVAPPVPAAPVPLPAVGTMVVGHAEDRAEADADRMADVALARLRRTEAAATGAPAPEAHQHGPGCDHLRRSPAPSATPVVGYEGGALDPTTSDAITSRRGTGRPLDGDVRRRMETAFGTSLSGVRIHADDTAARLNTAVSARAFTTGNDVFFGKGEYSPTTPGGERVLAHEIAHTLQPSASARRLHASTSLTPATRSAITRGVATTQVIHRWDWWDKRKEKKAEEAKAAKAKKDNSAYAGVSGKETSWETEVGKPLGAGAAVGGVALGTMLGGVAGGTGETLSGILGGDTGAGLAGGFSMAEEAEEFRDKGLGNLADRKKKAQGLGLGSAAISAAGAGVQTALMKGTNTLGVWDAVKTGGQATLGTTAGALGVAGGSVQVLQGAWRGGKAVMKLCRLTWGRAQTMLSKRGERWKKAIVSAEKYKGAIAAMKVTLGALGIAAGALLIVSNPIGWGIGLAAALAGGAYAVAKIVGKVKTATDRASAAKRVLAGKPVIDGIGTGSTERGADTRLVSIGRVNPDLEERENRGFRKGKEVNEPTTEREKSRAAAIAQANAIGREASEHAVLADELRGALGQGNRDFVVDHIDKSNQRKGYPIGTMITDTVDRELHDAFLLLSSINVDTDEALADSGQELIEKKLSKVEAM
jgi:hypothetical protein